MEKNVYKETSVTIESSVTKEEAEEYVKAAAKDAADQASELAMETGKKRRNQNR